MKSVADYAGAYRSHLGLPGELSERIIAQAMDIATAASREDRG